jgi:hypothetical protein
MDHPNKLSYPHTHTHPNNMPLNLNKGESEQMYKDAFELLMLKDELIRDLQSQLESERTEVSLISPLAFAPT